MMMNMIFLNKFCKIDTVVFMFLMFNCLFVNTLNNNIELSKTDSSIQNVNKKRSYYDSYNNNNNNYDRMRYNTVTMASKKKSKYSCRDKEDEGHYEHVDCRKYWHCLYVGTIFETALERKCPIGTMFHPIERLCEISTMVDIYNFLLTICFQLLKVLNFS